MLQEATTLRELLTSSLSDLRMEIADTDSADYREGPKEKKGVLSGLLQRLEGGQSWVHPET